MARRRTLLITREGFAYIAVMGLILLAAMLRDINLLFILFGMMLGLLAFSWRSVVVAFRGVDAERRVPKVVGAGDLLDVEIELNNRRRSESCWIVAAEDRIQRVATVGASPAMKASVLFTRLAPDGKRQASYRCRLSERGKYRFGPLRLSTAFPLGLLRRTFTVEQMSTVTVYPRLGRLRPGWIRLDRDALHTSQQAEHRQGFIEGDYHGLRDWRPGDSRRWIHWRTTARKGELMVRQFEQHTSQDLAMILDLWQPARPQHLDWENGELAVSFAATLVAESCRRGGGQLMLAVAARLSTITRGPASMAFFQDAMESLAVAEADRGDSLAELLPKALAEVHRGSQVILISTHLVDLNDTDAFSTLWQSPQLRSWIPRVRVIDASSAELAEYFQAH